MKLSFVGINATMTSSQVNKICLTASPSRRTSLLLSLFFSRHGDGDGGLVASCQLIRVIHTDCSMGGPVLAPPIIIFCQNFSKPCFHLGRYVWLCPACGTANEAVRDGDWSCTHRMQKPDLQWLHFQLEQYEIEINLLWKCLF